MSVQRTFLCNVCAMAIKPTEGASRDGIGLNWTRDAIAVPEWTDTNFSEDHICLPCLGALHKIYNELQEEVTDD